MKHKRWFDITVNVLLPAAAGIIIHLINGIILPSAVSNRLVDALSAYTLFSAILIIWSRKVEHGWLATIILLGIFFEVLQYYRLFAANINWLDMSIYIIAFIITLLTNAHFSRYYQKA